MKVSRYRSVGRLALPATPARRTKLAVLALAGALLASGVPSSARAASVAGGGLTVEQIFADEPIAGRLPSSVAWAPDGSRFLYTLPGGRSDVPVDMHVYDVRAKHDRIFFKAEANGKGARPTPEFVWSPDSRRLAYLDGDYQFDTSAPVPTLMNLSILSTDAGYREGITGNAILKLLAADAEIPQPPHLQGPGPLQF